MPAPVEVLREIVRRYGTPTYAYDIGRVRAQVAKLRAHLPAAVEILYSLKANASLGHVHGVLAECGLGLPGRGRRPGELASALAAGFSPARIFLTGPDRSPAVLTHLRGLPEMVVSVDSVVAELRPLGSQRGCKIAPIVRLRVRTSGSLFFCHLLGRSRLAFWFDLGRLACLPRTSPLITQPT